MTQLDLFSSSPDELGDCPVCGWPAITVGDRAWCARPYSSGVVCPAFQFARRRRRGWRRLRSAEGPLEAIVILERSP